MEHCRKILICEDEFLIRMFLDDLFQEAGWSVYTASSGDEAVELLDGCEAVITDLEMPGEISGIDLAWHVFRITPDVPVVLMSGRILPKKAALPPNVVFLAKPVPGDVLLDTLEGLVQPDNDDASPSG